MEDIVYISYFIENQLNFFEHYEKSVLTLIKKFYNKPFIFVTEQKIYDKIKDKITNYETLKIIIIDFTETNTYKKYFDRYNNLANKNAALLNNISAGGRLSNNNIRCLIIWHYKFELILLAKTMPSYSHVCYIDAGICRDSAEFSRIRYSKGFCDSNFFIKDRNDIIINSVKKDLELKDNVERLLLYGEYEIACNHLCFSINYLDELNLAYFKKLEDIADLGIITSEQRIFTLVMRDKYKLNPNVFTLKRIINCSYTIQFHM